MTRLPIIRSIKPNTFNVGKNLPPETILKLKGKGWLPLDWSADIELEETPREIVRIMESNSDYKGEL